MAQDNIFGHLLPSAPAPTQQPRQDPIIRRADPYKDSAEQRAQEAASRAAEDQRMQREKFDWERRQREAEVKAGVGAAARESENKAAAFLLRALGSNDSYEAQEIGARSWPGQALSDTAPNLLNALPESVGNSPRRQVADTSQNEFIAASLRQDSGAAIPEEEMERQRQIYFPMPGDTADVIAAKRQARLRAIEGLKQSAGPMAEQTIAKFQGMERTPQAREAEGLFGSVTDDSPDLSVRVTDETPWPNKPGNNVPPSGGNGGGSFWQGIGAGVGDIVEGATNNTVGLLINPINTVAGRAMGYEGFTSDIGQTLRDALQLPEGNQTVSAINQAAAGGLSAGWLARKAGQVLGNNALAAFGATPVLDAATGATAAAAGEGARQAGAGPVGQAAATLAGGFAPSAMMGGRNALLNVAGRNPPRGPAPDANVIAAGERQGVPIRQPDARTELRGDYAALESGQRSGPMISQAREADTARIEERLAEVGGQGNPSDQYGLGTRVQAAGQRYIASTKAQANRLYDRVREVSAGKTVTARNADAALDTNIQELRAAGENSNAAAIKYLEGLRNDIDRGLTVDAVQNLRSNMRGQLSERGLTGTDTDRRVMQVIDGMNQDLTEQLPAEASAALRAADDFYRKRQEFINGTLKQFMGDRGKPLPAETAATRLISMAQGKGNFDRFSKMWGQLDDGEKSDVAATIAASLGRKQNGDFSPAALIKSLDPIKGVNPRTARLVFGEDGAKALADLRIIAQAKTDAMGRMAPSGKAISGMKGGLRTLMLSTLGLSQGGIGGAVLLPAAANLFAKIGEERAARLMLNPDFTKWLRAMPEATNPKAINAYFGKLKASGARSQVAANDIEAFTSAVVESFAQSPRRAAAQEEDN